MHHVTIDRVQHALGVGAVGEVATKASGKIPVYGEYLSTHGFGLLSWSDWAQVVASIYIIILILKTIKAKSFVIRVYRFFYPDQRKIDECWLKEQRENDVLDKKP